MTTNLVKQKQMIVTAQRKSITSINLIDEIPEAILEIIFYYAIGTNKLGSIFFIRKIKILSKRWRNWIFRKNVFSGKSLNELVIKNEIGIQKSFKHSSYHFFNGCSNRGITSMQTCAGIDICLPKDEFFRIKFSNQNFNPKKIAQKIRSNSNKLRKCLDKLDKIEYLSFRHLKPINLVSLKGGNFWKKMKCLKFYDIILTYDVRYKGNRIAPTTINGLDVLNDILKNSKKLEYLLINQLASQKLITLLENFLKKLPTSILNIKITGGKISKNKRISGLEIIYKVLKEGYLLNLEKINFHGNKIIQNKLLTKFNYNCYEVCNKISVLLNHRSFYKKNLSMKCFNLLKINMKNSNNFEKEKEDIYKIKWINFMNNQNGLLEVTTSFKFIFLYFTALTLLYLSF